MMLQSMSEDNEQQTNKAKKLKEERDKALADAGLSQDELQDAFGVGKDCPYLLNISDDPTLAGCLMYFLKDGDSQVGSKVTGDKVVSVRGLGIRESHGIITNEGNN